MSGEWFWEGNIVKVISSYLQTESWTIERTANTETREAGVDIRACKAGSTLLIEIKGYPSKVYQRGEKKGLPKRTNPNTQARHWYAEVLLSALLRQAEYPKATIAIALPEFVVFTKLVRRTQNALNKLGIHVYFVKETGSIRCLEPMAH